MEEININLYGGICCYEHHHYLKRSEIVMTNREWLLNKMQNMSDEELAKYLMVVDEIEEENDCQGTMCCDPDCTSCVIKWLKSEHKEKITLSEAERVILENIDREYKWVCKCKNGALIILKNKPIKFDNMWIHDGNSKSFNMFNHLFQFITWEDEKAYNIEELLKGE